MRLKLIASSLCVLSLAACGEGVRTPTSKSVVTTPKLVLNDTGVNYFIDDTYITFDEQINRKDWVFDKNTLPLDQQSTYTASGSPYIYGTVDYTKFPKIPQQAFTNNMQEPANFPGQDGSSGKDVLNSFDGDGYGGFQFVALDSVNGTQLPVDDSKTVNDYIAADGPVPGCIKDLTTGLVWEHKTKQQPKVYDPRFPEQPPVINYHSAFAKFSWYDPNPATNGGDAGQANGGACATLLGDTQQLIAITNQEKLCGFSDWRLPTLEEMRTLIDYQVKSGTIPNSGAQMTDSRFFPNAASTGHRWSSQSVPSPGKRNTAYGFHFHEGQAQAHDKYCNPSEQTQSTYDNGVLLVRTDND